MRSRGLLPIDRRLRGVRLERTALRRLIDRCLTDEGVPESRGLGLVLCGDRLMRALNRSWRGLDRTTDVLSFASGEPRVPVAVDPMLGEVIVSIPRCRQQAAEQGVDPGIELVRLVVHGLLHVLGYDHERPSDRARMVPREKRHRDWARRQGIGVGLLLENAETIRRTRS